MAAWTLATPRTTRESKVTPKIICFDDHREKIWIKLSKTILIKFENIITGRHPSTTELSTTGTSAFVIADSTVRSPEKLLISLSEDKLFGSEYPKQNTI